MRHHPVEMVKEGKLVFPSRAAGRRPIELAARPIASAVIAELSPFGAPILLVVCGLCRKTADRQIGVEFILSSTQVS